MNKKGMISPLVIALVIVVGLVAFLASPTIRFTLIGISIIGVTLIFIAPAALSGDFTREKTIFLIIMIFIGGVIIAIPYTGIIQQTSLAEGYFEAPFFATVMCAPAPGGENYTDPITISGGKFEKCPVNTKNCDVLFSAPSRGALSFATRLQYRTCSSNSLDSCNSPQYYPTSGTISTAGVNDIKIINDLPKDKYVYLQHEKYNALFLMKPTDDPITIKLQFIPYILKKQDSLRGGLNPISGSKDCRIPLGSSEWIQRITFADFVDTESKQADIRESNNYLEPDDQYNYISGTVTRALFGNAIDYKNQKGYCVDNAQNTGKAIIYIIAQLETAQGIGYNIVDTKTELGREECCQEGQLIGNRLCKNFNFEEITVDEKTGKTNVPCGFDIANQCNVGRFILSDDKKTSFEYQCVNNYCIVANIQQEECTRTSQCGTNEACINFKCEETSTIPKPIGEGDTASTTDEDKLDCPIYQQEISTNETDYGILGWRKLFNMGKTVSVKKCVTNSTFVLILLLSTILIFTVIITTALKKPKKKGRK